MIVRIKDIVSVLLAVLLGLPMATMMFTSFQQAQVRRQEFQKRYEETVREIRAARKEIEQAHKKSQERSERFWRLYEERIKQ